ncbi:Olfactomedin-like protein 2B [Dirofilaria immitis]|nr:Olfactomedin-like protein 2B [Dirofilaria immitis]
MLKCDKNRLTHTRTRRQSTEMKRSIAEQLRRSKLSSVSSRIHNQWIGYTGQDTIIPKIVFELSCKRIHRHCAAIGRKLMGIQGHAVHQDREVLLDFLVPWKSGQQGKIGPIGLIGNIGEEGKAGINGRCNCSISDTVFEPSIIQVITSTTPSIISSSYVEKIDLSKLTTVEKITTRIMKKPTVASEFISPTLTLPGVTTIISFISDITTVKPYDGPPTLGYNRRVCLLDAVGIPVLHAESQYSAVGSWMRDNSPYNDEMAERRWVTDDYASPVLYEYENERQLMNKKQKIKYYIDYLASGTGNIIYNGSYYYHRHSSSMLVKYDLESTDQIQMDLGDISYLDCIRKQDHTFENCNETDRDVWLYNRPHNYVDYSADENGLWAIYVRSGMQHITVSKIKPDMHVVQTWDIYELNATGIAETFIMCGILYGLKSVTDRDTVINFAYDLFRNETIDVNVKWYNPYGGMTMLHYNPVDGRLYFFDSKRLLSVNVRVEGQIDQFKFSDFD